MGKPGGCRESVLSYIALAGLLNIEIWFICSLYDLCWIESFPWPIHFKFETPCGGTPLFYRLLEAQSILCSILASISLFS